jgi:hypothetical protein
MKSYADTQRQELTFEEGEFVYLKVSPIRGLLRFKVKGKFSPRYIGPFKILERKGEVAYQLACATVRCAQRVPHIPVEEVFEGTRGTVATGGVECKG